MDDIYLIAPEGASEPLTLDYCTTNADICHLVRSFVPSHVSVDEVDISWKHNLITVITIHNRIQSVTRYDIIKLKPFTS